MESTEPANINILYQFLNISYVTFCGSKDAFPLGGALLIVKSYNKTNSDLKTSNPT